MNNKGFTLIELLAVIVILGIVVAIAIPGINSVIRNSRQKSLNSEAKIIQSAALRKTVGNPSYSFSHINRDNLKAELEADGSKFDYIGIDNNNGKITVTLIKDNMVGYSSNDDEITNAKIYGLHWDGGSNYTRLDDAVGLVASVGTDTLNPYNDFDYADIYKDIYDVEEDGNMFVKIPRFYIKKEVSGNSWTWRISKKKHDESYYLPAVFQDQERGILLPSVLVGKYNVSLDSTGTKIETKTNTSALVSKSRSQFRNLITNTSTSYHMIDIHTIDILQALFTIEFATMNSKSIMQGFNNGNNSELDKITEIISSNQIKVSGASSKYIVGQYIGIGKTVREYTVAKDLKITDINGSTITFENIPNISTIMQPISVNDIVYNVGYINGSTDNVISKSGSLISNTSAKHPMKYRGIENFYGNLWQFVDGINIVQNKLYVSENYLNYKDNTRTGYEEVDYSIPIPSSGRYTLKFGYDNSKPYINVPIEGGTSTQSNVKESYYYNENGMAYFGGGWFDKTYSGKTHWALGVGSTLTRLDITTRIIKRVG